jgi:hypothetical protein
MLPAPHFVISRFAIFSTILTHYMNGMLLRSAGDVLVGMVHGTCGWSLRVGMPYRSYLCLNSVNLTFW